MAAWRCVRRFAERMLHMSFFTDDGRVLTPPKTLEPLLEGAYPAFYALLGHIRFFYTTDEVWDGKAALTFRAAGETLAEVTLGEGAFRLRVGSDEFQITSAEGLEAVYVALRQAASAGQCRPVEQLTADLAEYPNGIRCDMCLLHPLKNQHDFEGCRQFPVMDRYCYYGVAEGWGETTFAPWTCAGKQGCYDSTLVCLAEKGFPDCLTCGEYRTCGRCGVGHNPGECNLGITAEEVTGLILPYCDEERLDYIKHCHKQEEIK